MDIHLHALSEHQKFLREFIALYKQQQALWDKNHPNYRNRSDRLEGYEVLLKKCKEYIPEADEDYVRLRIDSMRSTFRKEHNKVLNSRKNSTGSNNIYKPSLWYYELLLFTAGEDCEGEATENKEDGISTTPTTTTPIEEYNVVKIPFWGREYSSLVINLYKKYTCLYALNDPNYKSKQKRVEAVQNITQELMTLTGKIFTNDDVRRKIHLLRGQFMFEYRKVQKSKSSSTTDQSLHKPTLWCYDKLVFLKKHIVRMDNMQRNTTERKRLRNSSKQLNSGTEYNEEDVSVQEFKQESDSSSSSNQDSMEVESSENVEKPQITSTNNVEDGSSELDVFDAIGKNVAHRLRDMTPEQNEIAQRILHDLMYHGQMENLTPHSKLSALCE